MSGVVDSGPTRPEGIEGIAAVLDHAAIARPRLRDLLPFYHELLGELFSTAVITLGPAWWGRCGPTTRTRKWKGWYWPATHIATGP